MQYADFKYIAPMSVKDFLSEHQETLINLLYDQTADLDDQYAELSSMYMHVLHMSSSSYDQLNKLDQFPYSADEVVKFVNASWDESAGQFGAYEGADGHVNETFFCFQALLTLGLFRQIVSPEMARRIHESTAKLVTESGEVCGDLIFRGVDTRFSFSAVCIFQTLQKFFQLEPPREKLGLVQQNVLRCYFDGCFSASPGQEAHAANTYVCFCTLHLLEYSFPADMLREITFQILKLQSQQGGFSGRPEKLPDSCYSQWCAQTLRIIARLSGKDFGPVFARLKLFLFQCYDADNGGFADREGNMADIWHTHFSMSFLSGLEDSGLNKVCEVWDIREIRK